ncbi:hypothetical protein NPIL_441721 [Nephila pilipes]|uniref:Uncharacterized protein n=1 Tax=Nephila pilipes TaxID=299642 RepID=A0A8X6N0P1_NEPPI|nr:hypothetical protein NPIL_441721 [Nephila pilipes]
MQVMTDEIRIVIGLQFIEFLICCMILHFCLKLVTCCLHSFRHRRKAVILQWLDDCFSGIDSHNFHDVGKASLEQFRHLMWEDYRMDAHA